MTLEREYIHILDKKLGDIGNVKKKKKMQVYANISYNLTEGSNVYS